MVGFHGNGWIARRGEVRHVHVSAIVCLLLARFGGELGDPFAAGELVPASAPRRCTWRRLAGYYLSGYAEVNEDSETSLRTYSSVEEAQKDCEDLGERCSGVTVLVFEAFGTADISTRGGALQSSPYGTAEVSYVKDNCEEETLECNGELLRLSFMISSVGDHHLSAETGACAWQPPSNSSYLAGYVRDDPIAFRTLTGAQQYCSRFGRECGGVTLQPCGADVHVYTPRAGGLLQWSPFGESSWLKTCQLTTSSEATEAKEGIGEMSEMSGEDFPTPSVWACDDENFARLLDAAAEFYEEGIVSVNLLMYMGRLLQHAALGGGWRVLAAECAPAVLQVLLLRAEERLYVDAGEYAGLMDTYQQIVADAHVAISAQDWARWPLLPAGRERVLQLQRQVGSKRNRSVGATVDFVLCFCGVTRSVGMGYAAASDSLVWLRDLLASGSGLQESSTRVFIVEKCGDTDDKDGLERTHVGIRDSLAHLAGRIEIHHVHDEVRADDATAYLDHLVKRYDDLADWTFFLHADAPEHVFPFRLLEELFVAARTGVLPDDFPFVYLSHNYLDLGTSKFTWDDYASPFLWRTLFGSSIVPPRDAVGGYCCVQFLVPRRRALLRQRTWYSRALEWFGSASSYWHLFPVGRIVNKQDVTCRAPAQLWMPWWHVVFGETLMCPERHLDERLPLFVQMRSIAPSRIHCC